MKQWCKSDWRAGWRFRSQFPAASFRGARQQIVQYLLYGTLAALFGLLFLLLLSYYVLDNSHVGGRIVICMGLILYTGATLYQYYRGRIVLSAWLLIILYGAFAILVLWLWSINTPSGILLLAFIIVLAGVTLGHRLIIPVTTGVVALQFLLQGAAEYGLAHPDRSSLLLPPSFGDAAGYGIFLGIFGLVSWISSKKTDQLLYQTQEAEAALQREKTSVAQQLEERTKALQETQLRETKYLYGFAELGQLSTALLHDLSNHLTVLSLEIEDLEQEKHSQAVARAQKSIRYLDEMVGQVRVQLREGGHKRLFNVWATVEEVFEMLRPKAQHIGVRLHIEAKTRVKGTNCYGDPVRFRYVMTILLTNAIDAYSQSARTSRNIHVALVREHEMLLLRISDWGVGIPAKDQQKVFQPFYSTKEQGMGIGLFIVKEMLTSHFHGTIVLEHCISPTVFRLQIPVGLQEKDIQGAK